MGMGSRTQPTSNSSGGTAAEQPSPIMQKFLDKWFLPFLFVVVGSIIVWTLWRGLMSDTSI